jgi:hypothetical protein
MVVQRTAARSLEATRCKKSNWFFQRLVPASYPHETGTDEEARTNAQGAIIEYRNVLYAWDYKWRGRRHKQQDHVDQASSRRLSQHRELQESDFFRLRWTRSLPTVKPDGPYFCSCRIAHRLSCGTIYNYLPCLFVEFPTSLF